MPKTVLIATASRAISAVSREGVHGVRRADRVPERAGAVGDRPPKTSPAAPRRGCRRRATATAQQPPRGPAATAARRRPASTAGGGSVLATAGRPALQHVQPADDERARPPAARSRSRPRRPGCRPRSGCTEDRRGDLGPRELAAEISTTEPYSPIARANASAVPAAIAGRIVGSTIRRKTVSGPAPSERAASSTSRSIAISTGWTVRTTNGSVTNSSATTTPAALAVEHDADRAVGAVQGDHHQAGDDRRQRERHVDDELEQPLAREASRTSTQATSVPITALTAQTSSELPIVSRSAAAARGR